VSECPCGSGQTFSGCCEPYLCGDRKPKTAEQTMRARYTAHVRADMAYIASTLHPEAREEHDEEEALRWAQESQWLGMEIKASDGGQVDDDEGHVEFVATYRDKKGNLHTHHELSRFLKVDGQWLFRDAQDATQEQIRRENPKVGRNEPCPCGSAKKYKKCCGKAA